MRIAYYALIAASLVTFASGCHKEENAVTGADKQITLRPTIATKAEARAPQLNGIGSGNFSDGDTFTLYTTSASGQTTSLSYTVGVGKLYWKDVLFAEQDKSVDFAACYPESEIVDGKFTFDLETASDSDLLWAHTKGVAVWTEAPVELTFEHVMHTLAFNFSTNSDEIALEQIKTECTAKSTCEVDLANGVIDNSSSRKATFSQTGTKAVFRIVPQRSSDVTIKISAGEAEKSFNLSDVVTEHPDLEGGKILTVNLTVKDGKITVDGSSIVGWGDQGSVDDEIIL